MDLWEHKPMLEKMHGQPLPGEENLMSFQGKNGNLMKSPWPFVPAGECGKPISSMLPEMARHVDDIAFCHALQSKTNTHGPGNIFVATGHPTEGCIAFRPDHLLWIARRIRQGARLLVPA